mgnify:CR=1 FL=1
MWFENHLKNDHHRHFGTKNSAWLKKHNLEKSEEKTFLKKQLSSKRGKKLEAAETGKRETKIVC